MSIDALLALYHSGGLFVVGIVLVYILLRWLASSWSVLQAPGRSHYVTAFLTALGVVAVPAMAGTTPNASMLLTAFGTLVALLLPGIAPTPPAPVPVPVTPPAPLPTAVVIPPKQPGGFVRVAVMVVIMLGVATGSAFIACGGAQTPGSLAACEQSALSRDITVNGVAMSVENAVEIALSNGVAGIPAALLSIASMLGMPLALDSIDCALAYIEGKPAVLPDAGSGVVARATDRAAALAAAHAWVTQQRMSLAAQTSAVVK